MIIYELLMKILNRIAKSLLTDLSNLKTRNRLKPATGRGEGEKTGGGGGGGALCAKRPKTAELTNFNMLRTLLRNETDKHLSLLSKLIQSVHLLLDFLLFDSTRSTLISLLLVKGGYVSRAAYHTVCRPLDL